MAKRPDDPYSRATPAGRKVWDSYNGGGDYDEDWLRGQLANDGREAAPASSFDEQFEELFGKPPGGNYDPIDITPDGPPPRLDLTDELGGAGSSDFQSKLDQLYGSITKPRATPPAEDNAFGEDTLRALGAGVMQAGEMATGALEYGARQANRKVGPGVTSEVLDDITAGLADLRHQMGGVESEWLQGMSPEDISGLQKQILSLDPEKSVWRGGVGQTLDALGLKVTQSLPATVLTLLPAARWFRAGMSPAAITYLGASEGGLSLGGIANSIAQDIENMTPEQLTQESPRYRELQQQLGSDEAARQQLIGEAQGMAPLIGGVTVGAISSTAGRFLEPVFQRGAGLVARTGLGMAEEAVQEGPQSAVEQYVQNVAAQVYDQDRGTFQDVGEQAAQGAVVGGLSGGAFSAVVGGGHAPQQAAPSTGKRAPDRALGRPEPFENVFGENPQDILTPPPGRVLAENQLVEDAPMGVTAEMRAAMEAAGQQTMYLPQPGELEQMGRQGTFPAADMQPANEQRFNRVAPIPPRGQQTLPIEGVGPPAPGGPRADKAQRVDLGTGKVEKVHPLTGPGRIRMGQRTRGGFAPVPPPPPEVVDYSPDMSTPPGVSPDPRQQDFVTPAPQGMPDQPSAEPLQDILAQLDEMERPEATEREAVYLSADNIAQLQRAGELPAILERGVPLANFDGKGGLLIARDRQVADSLVQLRQEGADMQELLGTATGAGFGKPAGGQIAVQRRQNGAVVQESLVADEAAADTLASQWEQRYPNDDVQILTSQAAIGRRQRLLQQEQQKRVSRAERELRQQDIERTSQRVRQATVSTPDEGPSALLSTRTTARRVTAGATSPTRAAARLVGQAVRESQKPEQQRIGGFYPPDSLDFQDEREAVRYRTRFGKLADVETELELNQDRIDEITSRKFSERKNEGRQDSKARFKEFKKKNAADLTPLMEQREQAGKQRKQLLEELAEIRTRAKPVRRAVHYVKAAERLAPKVVGKTASEARAAAKHETEDDVSVPPLKAEAERFENLTDEQIDQLKDEQLEEAFKGAAAYLVGRRSPKKSELTFGYSEALGERFEINEASGDVERVETGGESPTQQARAAARRVNAEKTAFTYERLLKAHQTPSMKRRLIRRARNIAVAKLHGGKTASKPLTAKAQQMKRRPDVYRRRGKFETQVLAGDVIPQDESRENRMKRETQARKTRERLAGTVEKANTHLKRMADGKHGRLASERNDDGDFTDRAKNMIHGRAYFRVLTEFANAMVKSGNKSNAIIEEMQKVDELLNNAVRMPAEDFARVFAGLLRAESQTQVTELRGFGEFKNRLADPEQRGEANAEIFQSLLADAARLSRLEELKENPYYNSILAPLVHKFSDSTFRDGYPGYRPTEQELEKLKWLLDNWKTPRLREKWYEPVRRYFTHIGFKWTKEGSLIIPRDEQGRYDYHVPDKTLLAVYQQKFGAETESALPGRQLIQSVTELTYPEAERIVDRDGETIRNVNEKHKQVRVRQGAQRNVETMPPRERLRRSERAQLVDEFGKIAQANRVIRKFRAIVENPKTTVAGLIRTEQRLVRVFQELGLWTQTSPVLGTVNFRTPRAYRMVGPRLSSKELLKEEGRRLLLRQMRPEPLPRDVYLDKTVAARGEQPTRAETEMFLQRVTDPGPSIQEFRSTALKLNEMLDQTHQLTTLGQMLDTIVEGLPQDHMYWNLASRLRALGIGDTPVSWDFRGTLSNDRDREQLGAARWDDDPKMPGGRFRYIVLNRAGINRTTFKSGDPREPGAAMLHTLLHEAVHIATQGALDRSKPVRDAFTALKVMAVRFLHYEGGRDWDEMPYGLQEHHDVGEFVAEAFSNMRFQALLKRIPATYSKSLWERFTDVVKNILGIASDRPEPKNAFEAVMTLEHHIFTGQDRVFGGVSTGRSELHMTDEALRAPAQFVVDHIKETGENFRRGWARSRGPNAPLIMMTMRQIHKEFRRHFGPAGENPLDAYMNHWERRNAENSRLMEIGEGVSREWSTATEQTSKAQALEFSRLITEATLGGIHPDRAVTAAGNEHLKLPAAKARHAELAARFKALPARWQEQYKRVQKYYADTLEQETNLLMLNALRGVLATGDNAIMSRVEFDRKYTEDTVRAKQLGTEEGLQKEFGKLDRQMVKTLQEIASIPVKREGPYFPLTRYGDYVVYARKPLEQKTFTTSKEAHAYRAQKLAEDPTLEVNVSKKDDDEFKVYVTDVDFRTRKTETEAEAEKEKMIALYGREFVGDVDLKREFKAESTIQSGSALAGILANLKGNVAAQNAIKTYWLRSLEDRSFRKHQIRRKQREGVDYDVQHQSFANYVKQASYYISQLKYGWRMADAARDIDKFVTDARDSADITKLRLRQVEKELRKRDEMTNDIGEMPKVVRTATELGQLFMLFGPSYWLINATQPYMVTMPWLGARYGWGGASAALANAQGMIISPLLRAGKDSWGGVKALFSKVAAENAFNVLDQVKTQIKQRGGARASSYISMLEQLRQQSVIDLSWVAELRDISEGRSTSPYQRFMDASRIMAHLTEVNNRIVTAIAAYDLARSEAEKVNAAPENAHAIGIQAAKNAVAETQFDYSSGNKPRLFQTGGPAGKFAPLVFQFMQYSQHMYAMMVSNFATAVRKGDMDRKTAVKTLAGLFATHAAMGGVLGIALQPLKWAIGLLLMALGDDDKPYTFTNAASGESFDRWAREGLAGMMGNQMGAVVAQGLPELAGVRLTDRMALGTVYFLDLKTDTAESTIGSVAQGFLGPVFGYGFTGVRAGQYALQGEFERAIETLAPKAVRDVMRTFRFANDGLVNNAGDTVIDAKDLSATELFLQAMGFRPSEIADFYAKQSVIQETKGLAVDQRNGLLARFRKADPGERGEVIKAVAEFNKRFPANAITRSALLRSLTSKAEREASYRTTGASLRGRERLYAEEGDYYDDE